MSKSRPRRVTVEDGPHGWRTGAFDPRGRPKFHGGRNPTSWASTEPVQAARVFVGFNVCDKARWNVDELARIVKRVRLDQVGDPGASFVIQKGLYQDKPPAGERDCGTVYEDGAQVIILNLSGSSPSEFKKQIESLAETIAREFEQREVIVEFQKGGVSQETIGVVP